MHNICILDYQINLELLSHGLHLTTRNLSLRLVYLKLELKQNVQEWPKVHSVLDEKTGLIQQNTPCQVHMEPCFNFKGDFFLAQPQN